MHTPDRFITNFGLLAGISRLSLGVALGLVPSCAIDGATGDPITGEAADPDDDDDVASDSVCTTGKFRCHARIRTSTAGLGISAYATPGGYGPAELQSAYGIDPAITVTDRPTIAIVDAYGYTAIESDLATYRAQYGLPPCTTANGCLKVVNEDGLAAPLPRDPPTSDDWTIETALDIDMVSAACPKCNILVLQSSDAADGLFKAQNAAARLGATVISNSWGAPEETSTPPEIMAQTEAALDHPGIAIFVAAGDAGYNDANAGPDYPGTSAHVITVGGTRLVRDASPRGWRETAWSKGGSACSWSIPKPAYQTESPCAFKATTDIAAVGDPLTGLAVFNARAGGWIGVGGTSASAPFVAAIFAATGNGAQSSGAFLAANASKLNDVTIGSNGTCGTTTLLCNAAAGWDGPTGYGTPNAAALLPPGFGNSDAGDAGDEPDDGEVSGGCSTAGGAGAGMLLGLALLARRRRRVPAMDHERAACSAAAIN